MSSLRSDTRGWLILLKANLFYSIASLNRIKYIFKKSDIKLEFKLAILKVVDRIITFIIKRLCSKEFIEQFLRFLFFELNKEYFRREINDKTLKSRIERDK